MPFLDRDSFIALLERLGDTDDTKCLAAAREIHQRMSAAHLAWQDLLLHCPQLPWPRLREQLSLLDGLLFLGEDLARVTLMDPFRLRLRAMLKEEQSAGRGQESARPRPQTPPPTVPVNQPEMLSAYEILGLPHSASVMQIKTAYRKRIKECHPDLFAGMDEQAKALAERWTKALNAAYATLNRRN